MLKATTLLTIASGLLLALPAAAQDSAQDSPQDSGAEPIIEPLNRTEAAQQLPGVGDDEDQQAASQRGAVMETDLTPQAVQAIEEALISAGYAPGAADGVWTEETSQALTSLKRIEEIESEGVDMATLEALNLENRADELGLEEIAELPETDEQTTTGTD